MSYVSVIYSKIVLRMVSCKNLDIYRIHGWKNL